MGSLVLVLSFCWSLAGLESHELAPPVPSGCSLHKGSGVKPQPSVPTCSQQSIHKIKSLDAFIIKFHIIMHLSICNLNIPHPRAFEFWRSNSRPPVPKSCSNAPHVRPAGWANAPPLGHLFRHLTGQDHFKTIRYKYQMVSFKLRLDKGTLYLHLKCPWVSTAYFWSAIWSRTQYLVHQIT